MAATVSTRIARLAAISPRLADINLQDGINVPGAATIDGTAASTVVSNAAAGAAESGALAAAAAKLAKSGGDILTGIISVDTTTNAGGFRAGNLVWNTTTGAWISGSGVAMLNTGLVGVDGSGNTNFALSATDGSINAKLGFIAGWTINPTYLAKDTGTDATSVGMAPADYPFYAGATYANRAAAPFRVTPAGAIIGANYASAASGKRIDIGATNPGELQFYADLGSGSSVLAATIGLRTTGGTTYLGTFGSSDATNVKAGLMSLSYNQPAIYAYAYGTTGDAIVAHTAGTGAGINSFTVNGQAVWGTTTGTGKAIQGDARAGTGIAGYFQGNSTSSAVRSSGGTGQYALELAGTGTALIPGLLTAGDISTSASSGTGTAVIIDGSSVLRPLTSSERDKNVSARNWEATLNEMENFLALSSILFDYPDDIAKDVLGFSAEEAEATGVSRELINRGNDGLPVSIREHAFLAYQHAIIRNLWGRVHALEGGKLGTPVKKDAAALAAGRAFHVGAYAAIVARKTAQQVRINSLFN